MPFPGSSPPPPDVSVIQIRAFGTLSVLREGSAELRTLLGRQKQAALLAYLAVAAPRGFHRREALLALFWPELADAGARNGLNKAVHHLRRELGEAIERPSEHELGLRWSVVRCDVVDFEAALAKGERARALHMYEGELLNGFHLEGSSEFMQWLDARRRGLRDAARDAAIELSAEAVAAGDHAAAVQYASRARSIDSLDERALRQLLVALDGAGERVAALREHEAFAATLRDEFGVGVSPETKAVVTRIVTRKTPTPRPSSDLDAGRALDLPPDAGTGKGDATVSLPLRRWPRRHVGAVATALLVLAGGAAWALSAVVGPGARAAADGPAEITRLGSLTASSAAVRALLDGERKYQVGQFAAAAESYSRAVEADSTFALAYWRLAMLALWLPPTPLTESAIARAESLSSRLSETGRRHVRALRYYIKGDYARASVLYDSLVAANDSDLDALAFVAEMRNHHLAGMGVSMARAAEPWRRVAALQPGNANALLHLLVLDGRSRDREAFERDASALVLNDMEMRQRADVRVLRAFAFGDSAAQRAVHADLDAADLAALLQRVIVVSPDLSGLEVAFLRPMAATRPEPSVLGWAAVCEATIAVARGQSQVEARMMDSVAHFYPDYAIEMEAELALLPQREPPAPSRLRAMRRTLERAPTTRPRDSLAYRIGLAAALASRVGDTTDARRLIDRLAGMRVMPGDAAGVERNLKLARATMLAAQGQSGEALRVLGPPTVEGRAWTPRERMLRADLHAAAGDTAAAHAWLETFPSINIEDLPLLPWALYRDGRLYEAAGDAPMARRRYERALGIVAAADQTQESFVADLRMRLRAR